MRRAHRLLGLMAVLPMLAWLASGLLLALLGPNANAVEQVVLPTQAIGRAVTVYPEPGSNEARVFASLLGNHLLQRTDFGWRHLDPSTGRLKEVPTEGQLRALLGAAFADDPEGYGEIELVTADSTITSTGRVILLDWPSFTASYRSEVTEQVRLLQRIHRLGITGDPATDRWFMIVGASLGCLLALLGSVLLMKEEGAAEVA